MNIEQHIIEIKNQLKKQGYLGKKIEQAEFKKLYHIYGNKMTEREFAQNVLEMTYDQYNSISKGTDRAVILKTQLAKAIEQDAEKIKDELGEKGYSGKLIDYSELQALHQMYGCQMPEIQFARHVLDLNDTSYRQVKSEKRKVFILKTLQISAREDIEKTKEALKEQGYTEKLIDYAELQKLHQTYGKMLTENEFAQKVLEIKSSTYLDMKNHGKRAKVLKERTNQELQQGIEKIKEKLKEEGYVGKAIDYVEFQRLYKTYGGKMPEYQFAQEVLEINSTSYKTNLKKRRKRVRILKSLGIQLSNEQIEKIKQSLKSEGYTGKLINYKELQMLHQMYGKEIPEYQFAQDILEISGSLYGNLKYNERKRAGILKSFMNQVTQEEISEIQKVLEAKNFAGKLINYEELQRLHEIYGPHMQEDFFAREVLEISPGSYRCIKQRISEAQILCHNKKVQLIKSILLKESRWYTKEELEQICRENSVSIDKLIRQVLSNGTNRYNEDYKRVLEEKGMLWIGRTKLSEEFLEHNINKIMSLARGALGSVKSRYDIKYNSEDEDFIQNAIIWLSENAGEIEQNFGDYQSIMEKKIFNTIRKNITIETFMRYEITLKTISLQQKLKRVGNQENELQNRIAIQYDLEAEVIDGIYNENDEDTVLDIEAEADMDTKCIQEMKVQIENGVDKNTILKNVQKKFGLSKEELLEMMQNYLTTKGKIRIDKDKARRIIKQYEII